MSTPLEYIETEMLLAELKNRFTELVFIGQIPSNKKLSGDSYSICVKGTMHGSLGLVKMLETACLESDGD